MEDREEVENKDFLHSCISFFPSLICASRQTVNIQLTQYGQSWAYPQQSAENGENMLSASLSFSLFPEQAHVAWITQRPAVSTFQLYPSILVDKKFLGISTAVHKELCKEKVMQKCICEFIIIRLLISNWPEYVSQILLSTKLVWIKPHFYYTTTPTAPIFVCNSVLQA